MSGRAPGAAPVPASATPRSSALHRRALELMPGGVNSPARAMGAIGRDPIYVAAGAGGEVVDADGNTYIDYVCSWGPLILGHADPGVLAAVAEAADRGTSYGAPTEGELALAEEIVRRMPSVQMVRLTSSGTEATMSALRLARAATGRERVLKFAGAYHGHVDGLLAQAGSGLATGALPASPGVPASMTAATTIVPFNDPDALREACAEHHFAAIIAEPWPANMGLVRPDPGFLELLREQAHGNGALLIFDEVITGFRIARGGAQELSGVRPDLTIMGKVLGGGLPAAAYGGARELMELVAPAGDVYQAGTLAGNPLATAAGLATLRALDAAAYERLAAITERLAQGLREAAAGTGRALTVAHAPGLLTAFFCAQPVRDYDGARACDSAAYGAFCRALLARGIYPPPSQFEAWFPSLAHSDEQIERTVAAAAAALEEIA